MFAQTKVVAVLVASPALGSILAGVLAAAPGLRVRQFDEPGALLTHARLTPVDLFVLDFDSANAPAAAVARALRDDQAVAARPFELVALSGIASREVKDAALASGIDEVIVKPMSPRYLLERVLSRIRHRPGRAPSARPRRVDPAAFAGTNVVPLFGREHPPHY